MPLPGCTDGADLTVAHGVYGRFLSAIIASGGLTHFVCDEELDRVFLCAFRTYDFERLARVDERSYQSGTSEVKLYVPVLVAMKELGCLMNLIDYVPCYRTEAGTGAGFAFMYWRPTGEAGSPA